jgi:protein-S-isoprenylcysteine O-methyltransferase Ste14
MMTMQDSDQGKIKFHPAVLYLGCLVVGFVAEYMLPTKMLNPSLTQLFGFAFPIIGVVMIGYAVAQFNDAGLSPVHFRPVTKMVQTGVYHLSRNPVYVGMTLIYTGIGILANNLWIVGLLLVIVPAMNWGVIRPEEIYLEEKFGEAYRRYTYQVRRWL